MSVAEHFPQLRQEVELARQVLKKAEDRAASSGGFRKLEWLEKVKERKSRLRALERIQAETLRNLTKWGLCDHYKPRGL